MPLFGVAFVLSVVLGIVFALSAVPKLCHPRGFVMVVLEYRVLPSSLAWPYARLVPPLESFIALLLLSGVAVRSAAAVAIALLCSFLVAVGINMVRGRDLECHCFGKATGRRIGWSLLIQDIALLGASLVVGAVAREWLAAEPWSVLRLTGAMKAGDPGPLVWCLVLTAGAMTLARLVRHRARKHGRALASR